MVTSGVRVEDCVDLLSTAVPVPTLLKVEDGESVSGLCVDGVFDVIPVCCDLADSIVESVAALEVGWCVGTVAVVVVILLS